MARDPVNLNQCGSVTWCCSNPELQAALGAGFPRGLASSLRAQATSDQTTADRGKLAEHSLCRSASRSLLPVSGETQSVGRGQVK